MSNINIIRESLDNPDNKELRYAEVDRAAEQIFGLLQRLSGSREPINEFHIIRDGADVWLRVPTPSDGESGELNAIRFYVEKERIVSESHSQDCSLEGGEERRYRNGIFADAEKEIILGLRGNVGIIVGIATPKDERSKVTAKYLQASMS
jgi:hypothetical protein